MMVSFSTLLVVILISMMVGMGLGISLIRG